MRIENIEISNFQRISAVNIEAQAPVIVIAGRNEAGKTSLLEAIRIGITGDATRIKLKKDWSEMVRDGAKSGSIAIDAGEAGSATINLKNWKRECNIAAANESSYKVLLDPAQFAAMSSAERRAFLFDISDAKFSGKAVGEKMIARKASPGMVELVLPMLRSGFPAAHDLARDKAKEARGAWKGVTGETYGSAKAEGWEAPKPEFDATLHDKLNIEAANLTTEIESLNSQIGTYKARQKAFDQVDQIEPLQKVVDKEEDYNTLMSEIVGQLRDLDDNAPEKVTDGGIPIVCPHCGGACAMVSGTLIEFQEPTKSARTKWAAHQAKVTQLQADVRELDGKLAGVKQAKQTISAIKAATQGFEEPEDVTGLDTRLAELRNERQNITDDRDEQADNIRLANRADADTAKALAFHEESNSWEAVAEMLAPAGIPGEILLGAIKPFNKALLEVAEATTWADVTLDNEMEIRVGGRLYALASESAKWRADAALAYAIAVITGIKYFALDRIDVLDVQHRATCMMWINSMVKSGTLDGALLVGTFKEPPRLPADVFDTVWLEEGEIYFDQREETFA